MEHPGFTEEVDEEKLKSLLELGLDDEQCRLALMLSGNSVDTAATMAMEYSTEQLLQAVDNAR